MNVAKFTKPFIILYIVFLVLGYLFVKSSLNDKSIAIEPKLPEEKVSERKLVTVKLSIPSLGLTYSKELKGPQSILDFLEELRNDGESSFSYEKTLYTYGIELCCINGTKTNWQVLLNGEDITNNIDNDYAQDGAEYVLQPVATRTSTPQ